MMRGETLRPVALLFAVVATVGCGGSPSAPTPTAIAPYQGSWFGTTSQSWPISFFVSGNQITSLAFSSTEFLDDPSCAGDPSFPTSQNNAVSFTPKHPIQISGGTFSATCGPNGSCGTGGLGDHISGVFSSNTAASGTLDFSVGGYYVARVGYICRYVGHATWTATKR
jgi:hypothetical protein